MNVKLLRKVKRHILAEPKRLDMRTGAKLSAAAPCGTVACIAGWAGLLSGKVKKSALLDVDHDWCGIEQSAISALGLCSGTDRLFHTEDWPTQFAKRYNKAKTGRGRATAAAARIEHFIKTKGKE